VRDLWQSYAFSIAFFDAFLQTFFQISLAKHVNWVLTFWARVKSKENQSYKSNSEAKKAHFVMVLTICVLLSV